MLKVIKVIEGLAVATARPSITLMTLSMVKQIWVML